MNRNAAIVLTLMALLLLGYFYFFSPSPEPQKNKPVATTVTPTTTDSTTQKKPESRIDSIVTKEYGDLGSFLTGKEEFTSVENDVLKVTLSNHATVSEVNLKNYKTYSQQPLFLSKEGNNKFSLLAMHEDKLI